MDKTNLAVVTSTKMFLDTQCDKIDEDGLLSQRIFGPKVSYKCACGNYTSKTQHAGKRCPKCQVLCADSFIRYTTFAKIVLPFPIFKPTHHNQRLLKTIVGKYKYLLDTKQADLASKTKNYLSYDPQKDRMRITNVYDPETCIPLCIKGLYSLYLAICAISTNYNSAIANELVEKCFSYELLVTPAESRAVYKQIKNGNITLVSSEINKYYMRILKLCSYDWTNLALNPNMMRENYIQMITSTFYKDAIEDDDLTFYDIAISKYQHYTNKIYELIIQSLSAKEGIIRKDFLGKSIDFCSRSHVIVNPALAAYQIKIPKTNFVRLWFIEYVRFLFQKKNIKIDEVLLSVKLTESKITSKYPQYIDEFIDYMFSSEVDYHSKLVLMNRQPTLWRYGIPGMEVVGVSEHNATEVSPLAIEGPNMDFDGDTAAVIRIHDNEAQREIEQLAFNLNCIKYDHTPTFLHKCKGESMYATYTLLESKIDNSINPIHIDKLADLPVDNFDEIFNITTPVIIDNTYTYSYGVCLFNNWCSFNEVKLTKFTQPNEISKAIYEDSADNLDYHTRLHEIMVKLFWFSSLNYKSPLTFSFTEIANLDFQAEKDVLKYLPNNPHIGQHLYKSIIERIYDKIPETHFFGKLIRSKLGKVATQLARISGAIGYIADDNNIILDKPLTVNLIDGLDPDTFFNSAIGARKGLVDKNRSTPVSGYLERSLVLNLSPVEIGEEDCDTNYGMVIHIKTKDHAISLLNRYYCSYDPNHVTDTGFSTAISPWKLFTEKDIKDSIGRSFLFRSPITCQTSNFKICKKCFGSYDNIKSPFLGIITGQSIAEKMTQLSMRTFEKSACNYMVA